MFGATGVNLVIAVKLAEKGFTLEQGFIMQQQNLEEDHVMATFHHLNLATLKVVSVSFFLCDFKLKLKNETFDGVHPLL